MKKIFNAPRVEVVKIGNDIVTTSTVGVGSTPTDAGNALAPERYGRGRYDAEYDLY